MTSPQELFSDFAILDALGDGIMVADANFRLLFANRAALSLLGIEFAAFSGVSLWRIFETEDLQQAPAAVPRRLRVRLEQNGEAPWLAATLAASGQRYVLTFDKAYDAYSAQLERQLKSAEQRFAWITETVNDFFYLIDPASGQFSYLSPAFETLWGHSRESAYADAASALEAVLEEDRSLIADQIPIQDSKSKFDVEYRIRRPDGAVRWLHDRGFVARDDDGRITHYVGVATDITTRKSLHDARLQIGRLESLSRLTAELSHDFNNILGSIRVLTANAADQLSAGAVGTEELAKILSATERGTEVIRSLQAISRQEKLSATVCELGPLLSDVRSVLEGALGSKVVFRIVSDADNALVQIDPSAFTRSLLNLAVNAKQAMPSGGRFTLHAARETRDGEHPLDRAFDLPAGDYVRIEARDSGAGMSVHTADRAFDAFFTTRKAEGGTGMGLAIVYAFARQFGGAVDIQSAPGAGTTLRLLLPLVGIRPAKADPLSKPAPAQPSRLLLVDDEPMIRDALETFLVRKGFAVETAENAAVALQKLGARPFDVVLTDYRMPGMNGADLAERVKGMSPQTSVIIMSGFTGEFSDLKLSCPSLSKADIIRTLIPTLNAALNKQDNAEPTVG